MIWEGTQLYTSHYLIHISLTNLFHIINEITILRDCFSLECLSLNLLLVYLNENIIPLQVFTNKSSSLCLHTEKSSDLWFKVAPFGLNSIWYFSFKHSVHFLVVGSNFLPFSIILHFTSKFVPASFSFHIWDESVVSCSFFLCLKLDWWLLYLCLKLFLVNPV